MNTNLYEKARLLPYPVIVAAKRGDMDAINAVLKHFEGYIVAMSTRELFDEYGNSVKFLDYDLRRRLEIKLITAILTKFIV